MAKEYIAAVLNNCNGSCVDAGVAAALVGAADIIFDENLCPVAVPFPNGTVPGFPPTFSNILAILRNYNDGLRGPGACDDCDEGCTRSAGWHQTVCKRFDPDDDDPTFPTRGDTGGAEPTTSTFVTEFALPPDATPFERCECAGIGIGRTLQRFTNSRGIGSSMCGLLARQYAAARLNVMCARACVPEDVVEAMGNASCLLRGLQNFRVCCLSLPQDPFICSAAPVQCNPVTADKLKAQNQFPELRLEAQNLKDILEIYNAGGTDPGSCDEILRSENDEADCDCAAVVPPPPPPTLPPPLLPKSHQGQEVSRGFKIGFWIVTGILIFFVILTIGLLFWGFSKSSGSGRKRRAY